MAGCELKHGRLMPLLKSFAAWRGMERNYESSLDVADFSATAETLEGDWIDVAAAIFHRHGFCIILNALGQEEVSDVLHTCMKVEAEMLKLDPDRLGCRDAGRYSFGAASESGHMLHHPAWRHLLQSRPVLRVLRRIFSDNFVVYGGGGDFVLGGTAQYQSLHSDLGPSRVPPECRTEEPPMVSVNFTIQAITGENGPLRVVPGRRVIWGSTDAPPLFRDEPEVLRQSKLLPLPPGAAIIRDLRLWHGGTPNSSNDTRFLPSVEIMSLKYSEYLSGPHSFDYKYCEVCRWHQCCFYARDSRPCLPNALFETLPVEVQKICEGIRGPEVLSGMRPFARTQRSWENAHRSWSRWKSWHSQHNSVGYNTIQKDKEDWDLASKDSGVSSVSSQPKSSWCSHEWSEAKAEKSWHFSSGGNSQARTPNRSSGEPKGRASLKESFDAAGTVLAKTIRVTLGIMLFGKGLQLLNLISTRLENGSARARFHVLRALPAMPLAPVLSKALWIVERT